MGSTIRSARTVSLSAMGSRMVPSLVTSPLFLAKYPSRESMAPRHTSVTNDTHRYPGTNRKITVGKIRNILPRVSFVARLTIVFHARYRNHDQYYQGCITK